MTARRILIAALLTGSLIACGPALAAPKHRHKPAPAETAAPAAEAAPETPATDKSAPEAAQTGTVPASPEAATAIATTPETPVKEAAPHHEAELVHQGWPFQGAFGTYDRAALQRGFQVYKQVCAACHSLDLLSYRNLQEIGYTEGQVKAIAQEYQVNDIDDEGQPMQRPGLPSDRFHAPFPNKKAAMAANGAYPPDMSLLAKARHGGADYIYGILTGYADPPAGKALQAGQHWNRVMPGNIIAMPPPLTTDGQVVYEGAEGVPQTVDQYARDVSQFLAWAAEPRLEDRKRTGVKAILFLLFFAFIAYNMKKKVWRDVH
jgi:ubiquinol-cytochrome c reductase cytochrome c1 subunit